ncbi:MAG: hypothetical protein CML04_10170 [Pseudozobellia sp.]|mgnify:CR=1 FL=1|nr:hypothetical protein [Pseudozobellia sp.]MBG47127.1 hypothetical protein [Pseudozobellia sp.]
MPLFMDIHHIEHLPFTEEDAYKAHLRDVAVQQEFGVVYEKYYLNLEERTVCCLMKAPNMEACVQSHLKAHGVGACNVVKISSENEFFPYLGEGSKNKKDLATTLTGEIDTGFRTLLRLEGYPNSIQNINYFKKIGKYINKYKGNLVEQPENFMLSSFLKSQNALSCAFALQEYLNSHPILYFFNISVVTGMPVDDTGNKLFENTLGRLKVLSQIGKPGLILIDDTSKKSYEQFTSDHLKSSRIQSFSSKEERLLSILYDAIVKNIENPKFKVSKLEDVLGASKAQTYRVIKKLTGLSPNEIIREVRLRSALQALIEKDRNVSEIAFDYGFSSATYFTRVFKERFKVLPTECLK